MANESLFARIIISAQDNASQVFGAVANKWTALSAAFAAFGGGKVLSDAVSVAAEFEEGLDLILSKTDANEKEMEAFRAAALNAGATTSFSAQQAAEALAVLGAAGLDSKASIATLNAVLNMSSVESISLEEAAGRVIDTMTIMGVTADESGRAVDVMVKSALLANMSAVDVSEAVKGAGGAAHTAGMDIETFAAVLDVLAANGLRGSEAGTALSNIIAQLSNPASAARVELAKMGITTGDLITVFGGLKEAGDKGKNALLAFGLDAGPAVQYLVNGGAEAIRGYQKELYAAGGAAEKAAQQMGDNLIGALDGLSGAWDSMLTVLGTPLLEPLKNEIAAFTKQIATFTNSGAMDGLKTALVEGLKAAAAQLRAFLATVNWDQLGETIKTFALNSGAVLTTWANNVKFAAALVAAPFQIIQTTLATATAAFYGLAGGVASALASLTGALGGSDTATQAFAASAEANFQKAQAALDAAANSGRALQGTLLTLVGQSESTATAVAATAAASEKATAAQTTGAAAVALAVAKQQDALDAANGAYAAALLAAREGSVTAAASLTDLGAKVVAAQTAFNQMQQTVASSYNAAAAAVTTTSEAVTAAQAKVDSATAAYRAMFASAQSGSADAIYKLAVLDAQVGTAKTGLIDAAKAAGTAEQALQKFGTTATESASKNTAALATSVEEIVRLKSEIAALESEYQQSTAAGEFSDRTLALKERIAQLTAELEKALTPMADLGKSSKITTEQVVDAFKSLGVDTQQSLTTLAANAKQNFETIKESGVASSEDVKRAFLAYAEKALAAVKDSSAAQRESVDAALSAQAAELKLSSAYSDVAESSGVAVSRAKNLIESREDELQAAEKATKQVKDESTLRANQIDLLKSEAEAHGNTAQARQYEAQSLNEELAALNSIIPLKQAELTAAQALLTAKTNEANADGVVTTAEQGVIESANELVAAKQREIIASQQNVVAKEQEIAALNRAKSATSSLSDSVSDSVSDVGEAVSESDGEVTVIVGSWIADLLKFGKAALLASEYAGEAEDAFWRVYNAELNAMGHVNSIEQYLSVLNSIAEKATRAAEGVVYYHTALDALNEKQDAANDRFEDGEIGLSEYVTELNRAQNSTSILNDEDLSDLRSEIADAKEEMADFADEAASGLKDLQQEWAELSGQQIQAKIIEQELERLEIEQDLAQAKKDGNTAAIDALNQQLVLIDKIHQRQLEILAEESAKTAVDNAEAAAEEAARFSALSDQEKAFETTIAGLQKELSTALLNQDQALTDSLKSRISLEESRHQTASANLDSEIAQTKELNASASSATSTGSGGSSNSTGSTGSTNSGSSTGSASAPTITTTRYIQISIDGAKLFSDEKNVSTFLSALQRAGMRVTG